MQASAVRDIGDDATHLFYASKSTAKQEPHAPRRKSDDDWHDSEDRCDELSRKILSPAHTHARYHSRDIYRGIGDRMRHEQHAFVPNRDYAGRPVVRQISDSTLQACPIRVRKISRIGGGVHHVRLAADDYNVSGYDIEPLSYVPRNRLEIG